MAAPLTGKGLRLFYALAVNPYAANRKPLEEPASFGATWELRFGPKNSFRVFYDVNHEEKAVSVLAIGVKEGSRLFIGGQEFEL